MITSVRTSPAQPTRLGIVGGGAAGTVMAARLLRDASAPVEIVVFEPRERLGEGVAYSTTDPAHLLNVPARGMSALPEDPDHFRRWADCHDTDFLPRARYAEYLRAVLAEALDSAPAGSTLTHLRDAVTNLGFTPNPWVVTCNGSYLSFQDLVLATGNDAPAIPKQVSSRAARDSRIVLDPWAAGALDDIADRDHVLVIGTGLTCVDVCISLASRVRGVRIEAISRHGLVPQAHDDPWRPGHPAPDWDLDAVSLDDVLGYLKGFGPDWRRGLDSLRPITPSLWRALSDADRETFLLRLARFWDIHRHRMAPQVARIFARLVRAGRVRTSAAQLVSVDLSGERLVAVLSDGRSLEVDHIVLCTGPTGQVTGDPLGRLLVARGQARPGPFGLGYDIDVSSGALVSGDGAVEPHAFTVGPLRRGALCESTAMPEIRVHAADVSSRVLQRQPARV